MINDVPWLVLQKHRRHDTTHSLIACLPVYYYATEDTTKEFHHDVIHSQLQVES
jgi:hypothetical protein